MSGVVHHLRGPGWRWSPLWRFAFTESGEAVKVWTGREVMLDEFGQHLRRQDDGRITSGCYGTLIERTAPPPDRSPPTEEEIAATRTRRRHALLIGGAA